MNISKKTQYGLRALARLAKEEKKCSLRFLAEKEHLPAGYLEKVFSILEKNKVIVSSRGVQGGYTLARSADKISVGQIVELLEKDIAPVECLRGFSCPHRNSCKTVDVWRRVEQAVRNSLFSLSLKEII
jgi:Rrf2 family transcriptional regulator, cysteine metabolism repressor